MKAIRLLNIILVIAIVVAGGIIPLTTVHADTGPKPSMDFHFTFEITHSPTIVSGELLECDDSGCAASKPLARMGPQGFSCSAQDCSSLAYGYADYHRLRVDFSDGKARESNVFGKKYFQAVYRVTVRENDLLVKEQRGSSMPLFFFIFGTVLVCILPALMLILLVILIVVAVRAAEFSQARGLYIVAWLFCLFPLALNILNPGMLPGFIFTLVIELAIALGYVLWRKRPIVLVLTVVGMMNLLTRTIVSLLFIGNVSIFWSNGFVSTLIAEAIIWLVEAGILAIALRKQARFWEVLAFSAILNLASFGLGLLLPF
jgi:hypothetical protein